MGEIDAAGEFMTGALLGRAVEPRGGAGHGTEAICLNCGTALIGPHCYECGQAAHVHRSLGAIGHEILHGVAHFEGKLWRTLPMLVWRPGVLTRRYIAGERMRFVSPMAIFLFSIFAMFAVFSWAGIGPPVDMQGPANLPVAAIKAEREHVLEERAKDIKTRDKAGVDAADRAEAVTAIREADERLKALDLAQAQLKQDPGVSMDPHTGWETLDHGVEKWKKNPSLMIYKLQSSGYKFSWLLIPLSLPFVWLLFFWKRQYKLYDHTVFITYSIAFMSMLFIAITIGASLGVGSTVLAFAASVVPFVHITRQLQQAYRLRWRYAILRAVILAVFIEVVLVIFLLILLLLGITG
ncbi:DUF3667 domain-containing protein [Sphingomonas sp. CJ20]